jgi:hypothetical protein
MLCGSSVSYLRFEIVIACHFFDDTGIWTLDFTFLGRRAWVTHAFESMKTDVGSAPSLTCQATGELWNRCPWLSIGPRKAVTILLRRWQNILMCGARFYLSAWGQGYTAVSSNFRKRVARKVQAFSTLERTESFPSVSPVTCVSLSPPDVSGGSTSQRWQKGWVGVAGQGFLEAHAHNWIIFDPSLSTESDSPSRRRRFGLDKTHRP